MFTPRSPRARQHSPKAPGLSSMVTLNSFALAMRLAFFLSIADQIDSDNISLQLIRVRGVERMGMYRGRLYKLR